MANGADPTLKDKEGHTAPDYGYNPKRAEAELGAAAGKEEL